MHLILDYPMRNENQVPHKLLLSCRVEPMGMHSNHTYDQTFDDMLTLKDQCVTFAEDLK